MVPAVPDIRRFPRPSNIERLLRDQTSIPQPKTECTMPDSQTRFRLDNSLETLYAGRAADLACTADDPRSLLAWQVATRRQAKAMLGIADVPTPRITSRSLLHKRDRGLIEEEKWLVETDSAPDIPLYLLRPTASNPRGTLLVFHGHNPSVQTILGNYPSKEEQSEAEGRDGNYAQLLAEAGYLVCSVEQRGFGERQSGTPVQDIPNSCRHQSFFYQMLGRTMIGERCLDGKVALDFLATMENPVSGDIGITGNSGGGTTTLWLAAIDERLAVAVPGCYFCSFKESIMDIRHCECNYVPGSAGRLDMGDLAALIAPRPLRCIQGIMDPIFPIDASRAEFARTRKVYELLEA
ncbi:MAG: hypothetical protein F4Y80_03685, partial [Caldilineaceae bacterium SB0665_bin_21]|nr:hypothetical protein [Caldilineaceae bacterium SB0665_bin_21]